MLHSLDEITGSCPKAVGSVTLCIYTSFLIYMHNRLFHFCMNIFESVSGLYLRMHAR